MTYGTANVPLRRIATSEVITAANVLIAGATIDVTMPFDVSLPDTNYNVNVTIFSPITAVLAAVAPQGIVSKAVDGCVVRLKNAGLVTVGTITVDIVAVRRLAG